MSLQHIRSVREHGGKPAMVMVLIGDKSGWPDGPNVVHVNARSTLRAIDWLPLVGVWVTVHWLSGPRERAFAVLDCLERTGAKLFGAASRDGVHSLTAEPTSFERDLVRKEWELLCAT